MDKKSKYQIELEELILKLNIQVVVEKSIQLCNTVKK